MKNFILSFCLCISGIASAQIITIPDVNFKNALVSTLCVDTNGDVYGDIDVDTNNDGEIQMSEALAITNLNISYNSINLLDGIAYFSNITRLNCSHNQLMILDISGLTSLTYLDCNYNQLTTLNLSGLSSLTLLNCHSNSLITLNLSGLSSLVSLECQHNSLTTLNVSGLTSLTYLNCDSNELTTLNLSGLTNLSNLICMFNSLVTLNVSGLSNLDTLECSFNGLTVLDISGLTSLDYLSCEHNQLITLDASGSTNLAWLSCGSNQLTTIDVSGLTSLSTLYCHDNSLTTLDVSGLSSLSTLDCSDNQLTSLNVSGLSSLVSLGCIYNQLNNIDLSGLVSLVSLACEDNQLNSLDVSGLPNLISVSCSHNQLVSLFVKNGQTESVYFSYNPNLLFICCDASQIQDIQNAANSNGLTNCTISSLCTFTPNGTFSTIQGSATFDANNNGCDSSDTGIYQFTVNIADGVNTGTTISDNNGNFAIPLQAGSYTFTPILPNPNYFTITPSTAQIIIPDTSNNPLTPFCITPNGIHHDLEVTILPTTPARPGFDASYSLVYKNNGNQAESGSVSFSFDENVLDLLSASIAPNTTSTGVLTWNFSNLLPFQSESISLTFNCNTPTETPPLNVGDTLYFASNITGGQADETPLDNTFDLAQVVVGSYDPNDKTCLEGDIITPEMVGDYVHYMIRFENTGTYAAENVAVSDVIDVSRFDISSLQITASSHSMKTRISNGNEVEFIFEQINLAFDDANNDGYVAFKIKTLSTLQLNDTLKNQANIYFDYNAPITTNEAQTVVQYPNGSVSLGFNSADNTLNLFPNPAESILYIPADVQITQADIFDMKGALVHSVSVRNNQIEVQGLSGGTYFTRLYSDAKLYSAKFMVK